MSLIDDYGLRHLVEHLVQGEMLDNALIIIKPEFREVKRKHFGSDASFIHDLEIITHSLEQLGQLDNLPPTIRCSVIYTLLTGFIQYLPPEVVSAYVWFGEVGRAVELTTPSPEGEEKVAQLLAIAEAIKDSGSNLDLAHQILREAHRITQNLSRVAEGTEDLLKMEIAQQAAHLDWEWCQQILSQIQNDNIRIRAHIFVAGQLARDEYKASILLQVVLATITTGSFFLSDLSRMLGKLTHHHLETVQNLIGSVQDVHCQDIIRRETSRYLIEQGFSRLALAIARKIQDTAAFVAIMGKIAGRLANDDLEEAVQLVYELPLSERTAWAILDFIEGLQPSNAVYAYNAAIRIDEADKKCLGLARAALLFAEVDDVNTARRILQEIGAIVRQVSLPDISIMFLIQAISEAAAAVLLACEDEELELLSEWDFLIDETDHIRSQVGHLLLHDDTELALIVAGTITHPYLKGKLLARIIFYLEFGDSRIPTLQEQIARLAQDDSLSQNQVRHLQTYLLVSEGCDTPLHLLSLWENDPKPDARSPELQSTIVIGHQPVSGNINDDALRERDEMLVQLALDIVQSDLEQALIVLQAIVDVHRCTRGLIKLADHLSKQFNDHGQLTDYNLLHLPSRELYKPIGRLAKYDSQTAIRIVRTFPNRTEQAKACAVAALILRNEQLEQGRLFLERALILGQIQPVTALKTTAYLELDECISDEHAQINLAQKAISSLPTGSIPAALPQLNKHLVGHLTRRGEIESALQIAEEMTATHLILDIPDKVSAFLKIAELAIAQGKVPLGQEILDEALNLIRMTSYALPALPRLASLMHSFDPTRANKLFDVTVECAMDREMSMHRAQILQQVVYFQAPFNIQAALEAARKISDPYQKADALLTAVILGDLHEDETMDIVREAEELLAASSSNALVKGQALLKLVELNLSEQSNPLELIGEAIQILRQTQPADWYQRIGLLTQAYHHCRQLGAYDLSQEIISEVLEVARSDPFEQSAGMAQAAKLYLNYDTNKAVTIVFEILRQARLKDYDAVWKAIRGLCRMRRKFSGHINIKQHQAIDVPAKTFNNATQALPC